MLDECNKSYGLAQCSPMQLYTNPEHLSSAGKTSYVGWGNLGEWVAKLSEVIMAKLGEVIVDKLGGW